MQFILYSTDQPEPSAPPSPEMLAELGKLTEDSKQAGILVTTGGVSPKGTRVRRSGDKFGVTDGPFIEAKELMGGFAVINVKSLDEAVAWAKRFRAIVGDGETEIVQIFGPDDFAGA
jgi:hypothetical protein